MSALDPITATAPARGSAGRIRRPIAPRSHANTPISAISSVDATRSSGPIGSTRPGSGPNGNPTVREATQVRSAPRLTATATTAIGRPCMNRRATAQATWNQAKAAKAIPYGTYSATWSPIAAKWMAAAPSENPAAIVADQRANGTASPRNRPARLTTRAATVNAMTPQTRIRTATDTGSELIVPRGVVT